MRNTKKIAVAGGTVIALTAGGVAIAAWTSTGSGNGSVTAGQATNLVVEGTSTSGLYPTVTVPQEITVTNNNPYDVKLSSLTFNNASTTKEGCNAGSVTAADLSNLTDVVTKNGGFVKKTVQVTMSNDAIDACQGATFVLNYTASGASN